MKLDCEQLGGGCARGPIYHDKSICELHLRLQPILQTQRYVAGFAEARREEEKRHSSIALN